MAAVQKLGRCIVSETGKHTSSVFFLHGSGDTGEGLRAWVRELLKQDLAFPHIRIIYPTAPARPYTPMRGSLSNVWFDRYKISWNCPEHLESIDSMCNTLSTLIEEEVKAGIPKNRILLGGFSMGGAMALHLACRFHTDVAGVFALSSFLNKDSVVYQAIQQSETPLPELFQCHGKADELVLYQWGEDTNNLLKARGMKTSFHAYSDLYHELSRPQLEQLKSWILQKLPLDNE
ncbi:LYPL1 protein, partial [Atractosteus spatula]|nr:LYPL1 protein [Atractosteus spatula]